MFDSWLFSFEVIAYSAFSLRFSQFMDHFLFQDVVQQNSTLIEEMLHLIIMAVGKCSLFWGKLNAWIWHFSVTYYICGDTWRERNLWLFVCTITICVLIVGERFTPGIGHVDTCDELKREIIHQLCIRPMAHSELVKALPENVSKHTHLCATLHLYFSASLCIYCVAKTSKFCIFL